MSGRQLPHRISAAVGSDNDWQTGNQQLPGNIFTVSVLIRENEFFLTLRSCGLVRFGYFLVSSFVGMATWSAFQWRNQPRTELYHVSSLSPFSLPPYFYDFRPGGAAGIALIRLLWSVESFAFLGSQLFGFVAKSR